MRLPHVKDLNRFDVAVVGIPSDGAQFSARVRGSARKQSEAPRCCCATTIRAGARRRRAVLSLFDVDFVDPAFAPGTGTPEVDGPSSRETLAYVRALTGIDFRDFDCVEVSPPYDPRAVTAILAAQVCFEMLSLVALRR